MLVLATATLAAQGTQTIYQQYAPIDLTGTWVSVVTEDWRWRMMTPPRGDYAAVPLNAEGRRVADNWDPKADEADGLQCKVFGAPSVTRLPGRLNISWTDDNTLQVGTDAGTQTRALRWGGPAAGSEHTWQGHSSAIWEFPASSAPGAEGGGRGGPRARSGQLKVVTTNLRAGYLRKNGVPYSDKAALTEYFTRTTAPNGDEWLVITAILDDPPYLNERFVTSTHFKKEPDNSRFAPTPCVVFK